MSVEITHRGKDIRTKKMTQKLRERQIDNTKNSKIGNYSLSLHLPILAYSVTMRNDTTVEYKEAA